MVRYCKVTMLMKFLYKENKAFQYFIVADTKYKKYVLQNKYTLNNKLEEVIERNALSNNDSRFIFLNRRDEDDRITLEFSYSGSDIDKKPTGYFAIVGEIPYSDGCEECKYRNCDFCTKKEKKIEKYLKTCKLFSQSNK